MNSFLITKSIINKKRIKILTSSRVISYFEIKVPERSSMSRRRTQTLSFRTSRRRVRISGGVVGGISDDSDNFLGRH